MTIRKGKHMTKYTVYGTATTEVQVEANSWAEAKKRAMSLHRSCCVSWHWHECDVDIVEED